jgi:hypothetical protein
MESVSHLSSDKCHQRALIRSDGYICATELARGTRRFFGNWKVLKSTRTLIKLLSAKLQKSEQELIHIVIGGSGKTKQGAWIHPDLAVNFAQWISSEFALKVSEWINEWRKQSQNEHTFANEIGKLVSDRENINTESIIADSLAKKLNGQREVECESGIIDILTNSEIIEVKHASKWKHAIGQVQCYNYKFGRQMRIHLFYYRDESIENMEHILNICSNLNISVTTELYES